MSNEEEEEAEVEEDDIKLVSQVLAAKRVNQSSVLRRIRRKPSLQVVL